jgi:hypothetical protein
VTDTELLLDKAIPDLLSTTNLSPELAVEVHYLAGRTGASNLLLPSLPLGLKARDLLMSGELAEARFVLEQSVERPFSAQGLAAAIWTGSRIGSPELLQYLGEQLGQFDGEFVVDGEVPLGPRLLFSGLIAAAVGRLDEAADQLSGAARVGDQRAPVWGAIARVELGRVQLTMADLGYGEITHQRGRRTLVTARTFFSAGGFTHLASVAGSLMAHPSRADAAAPGLGHFSLRQSWWAGFGVQPPCELRKGKGLLALQYLIENRGRRVPSVELESVLSGEAPQPIDLTLVEQLMNVEDGQFPDSTSEIRAYLFDDRVRSRVSKLLSRTVKRITEEHVLLGEHLLGSLETGFACRYNPQSSIVWNL